MPLFSKKETTEGIFSLTRLGKWNVNIYQNRIVTDDLDTVPRNHDIITTPQQSEAVAFAGHHNGGQATVCGIDLDVRHITDDTAILHRNNLLIPKFYDSTLHKKSPRTSICEVTENNNRLL